MEKIKKFVREKALKKLTIITGLLFAVWINFIIFAVIAEKPLTFAHAQSLIKVGATVPPANPVQKTDDVEADNKRPSATDYKSSDYRLVVAIADRGENDGIESPEVTRNVVLKKSMVTFRGKTIYPNSDIFLVIRSDKIFTSVKSDVQGNWFWTNLGLPLENGQHTIEASSFSPYDLSGKRDIFVQKFSFQVEALADDSGMEELALENIPASQIDVGENEFFQKLRSENPADYYLFDIAIINKKEFNPGDEVHMNMFFNPLGKISRSDAGINYEIYYYNEENFRQTLVSSFSDSVDLSVSQAFLKKIKLKEDVQEGSFLIKVTADIGEDRYVQSAKFTISPKILIQIGSVKVDEKKFAMAVTWDVIFILSFALLILILIIAEYRHMSMINLLDEDELRSRHFFSNQ